MKVEYNERGNFNHIIAEDGMVITDYIVGSDIMEYTSSKELYCPANTDLSAYYEITDAEDEQYLKEQEDRIRELNSKEDENI